MAASRSLDGSVGACGTATTSAPPPSEAYLSRDRSSSPGTIISGHVHLRRSTGHGVVHDAGTCHPIDLERTVGWE